MQHGGGGGYQQNQYQHGGGYHQQQQYGGGGGYQQQHQQQQQQAGGYQQGQPRGGFWAHNARQPGFQDGNNNQQQQPGGEAWANERKQRKQLRQLQRRTVDFNNLMAKWLKVRAYTTAEGEYKFLQQDNSYVIEHLPPMAYADTPQNAVCSKFAHLSINKLKCPITAVSWMPEGRRVITGSSSGEFTLWNGSSYNFETILQAHDSAVRVLTWSHSGKWFVSADHAGYVKYWQSNMSNLKVFQGHKTPIRALKFSPNDSKFATCGDDALIKVWDFTTGAEERLLTGHGWDIKCLDWHRSKGLLVSGGKDNLIKMWDPRKATELCTLHGLKNMVTSVGFNLSGNLLMNTAKETAVRIWDIRMLREIVTLRGNVSDVNSSDWHPIHPNMLVTGGAFGQICYFNVDHGDPTAEYPPLHEKPGEARERPNANQVDAKATYTHTAAVQDALFSHDYAHESAVWSIQWHPMGHVVCSGSNDNTTKFWTRTRPADRVHDRWSVGQEAAERLGAVDDSQRMQQAEDAYQHQQSNMMMQAVPGLGIPGMGDTGLPQFLPPGFS